jgi:hypothetical protein
MDSRAEKVMNYCRSNLGMAVMKAVDTTLGK